MGFCNRVVFWHSSFARNGFKIFFGIHIGYIIGFAAVERGDNILCVYTGRYLKVEEN